MFTNAKNMESSDIDGALSIYFDILDNFEPMGIDYYVRPCILLEKQKRYDEAIVICKRAIDFSKNPTVHFDADALFKRLQRLERKKSNIITTNSVPNFKDKQLVTTTPTATVLETNSPANFFSKYNWLISVTFSKSSSPQFANALQLARIAREYLEYEIEGKIIYQAFYTAEPKDYLAFIQLYELVSKWKSTFTMINGQLVDRKIVSGLNYCYGDRCRSGRSDFCFGASEMTKNPFGCHRLQMSAYNNPWWKFGYVQDDKYIIDKISIQKRANEYGYAYQDCPCFNKEEINSIIDNLPDWMYLSEYQKITYNENGSVVQMLVKPKSQINTNVKHTEYDLQKESKSSSKNDFEINARRLQLEKEANAKLKELKTQEAYSRLKNMSQKELTKEGKQNIILAVIIGLFGLVLIIIEFGGLLTTIFGIILLLIAVINIQHGIKLINQSATKEDKQSEKF